MQSDVDFAHNHFEPFIFDNLSFLQLSVVDQERPGDPSVVLPRIPFEPKKIESNRDLLQDRKFQNYMLHRAVLLDFVIAFAKDPELSDQLDETITTMERELIR